MGNDVQVTIEEYEAQVAIIVGNYQLELVKLRLENAKLKSLLIENNKEKEKE